MKEKELREALRSAKRITTERGWRCPDELEIAAYVDGGLEGLARERIETHVAGCDFCLGQLAFLLRQHEETVHHAVPEALLARARELAQRKPRLALAPAWGWGAVAAAACLALVVTLSLWRPETEVPQPSAPTVPAATRQAPGTPSSAPAVEAPSKVRRMELEKAATAPELLSPQDDTVLARAGIEFRWREVAGSLFYEVRLVTAEGDLVWARQAQGARAEVPKEIQLVPGQKYYVWVVAHLPEGRSLKSRAVSFRVAEDR